MHAADLLIHCGLRIRWGGSLRPTLKAWLGLRVGLRILGPLGRPEREALSFTKLSSCPTLSWRNSTILSGSSSRPEPRVTQNNRTYDQYIMFFRTAFVNRVLRLWLHRLASMRMRLEATSIQASTVGVLEAVHMHVCHSGRADCFEIIRAEGPRTGARQHNALPRLRLCRLLRALHDSVYPRTISDMLPCCRTVVLWESVDLDISGFADARETFSTRMFRKSCEATCLKRPEAAELQTGLGLGSKNARRGERRAEAS